MAFHKRARIDNQSLGFGHTVEHSRAPAESAKLTTETAAGLQRTKLITGDKDSERIGLVK
ncbi:unnamed protein product [marine sediment metagenome]|uniref:Uncharacterized protein n=1 Tax=marine sediment metagenome TaxID=412755 RepID=X1HDL1_9ZZZZ